VTRSIRGFVYQCEKSLYDMKHRNVSRVDNRRGGGRFFAIDRNSTLCPSPYLSCLYLVLFILSGSGVFSLIPKKKKKKKLRRLSLPGVKNSLQNSVSHAILVRKRSYLFFYIVKSIIVLSYIVCNALLVVIVFHHCVCRVCLDSSIYFSVSPHLDPHTSTQ